MGERNQRLCTWSGAVVAVLFFTGFAVIARYIPPPLPTETAAETAQRYREHGTAIRLGMIISLFGITFYMPWSAAISVHLRRIEGRHTPMTYAQLGMGAALSVVFVPVLYFFVIAAFRPERSDENIQMLNDLGWVLFTGIIYTIFVQNLLIGITVLGDRRAEPVVPRWYGYYSIWTAIAYCPACLDAFSTTGPFAWNGIFSWWLSLTAFFIYIVVTTGMLVRANKGLEPESALDGASLAQA